ncbi:GNAT family N-acetyltransferase [Opitutus terrae]|uniref:GCN5-related N-acetyltransferase n=1 Tax=Opitutus terrae (strain DSM 11246 / JCM 15787 / PB90-1) TaxID=452637 RepID=B2A081_OPITP|nr:GNAT family N-acetyltransferase [Opitutus terrae]ACB77417.1 GCN5-related N-acetyltransferase [Opitutus terrae PB90-1]
MIRPIEPSDIPALFAVRVATDENRLTREQLALLGITEASVLQRMHGTFRGWLCECDGRVVGFAMGDRATGEMWVIAVLPDYIKRGFGSQLLRAVEDWLARAGCTELWLTTGSDPQLRAYAFYRHRGWEDWKIENRVRYLRKRVSHGSERR